MIILLPLIIVLQSDNSEYFYVMFSLSNFYNHIL